MIRISSNTLSILFLTALIISPLHADEAEDVIKYRQSVMKSVGGHMGAMAQIVRGKVTTYGKDLSYHATALATSLGSVGMLFPEGSDFGETDAKDEVWAKPNEFKRVVDQAGKAVGEFLKVVKAGDKQAISAKFKVLADSCKACHKDFRRKDESGGPDF